MAKSIFQKEKKTEKHKKKKQVTVLVSKKKKKYNLSLQLPSCLCTSLNILERIIKNIESIQKYGMRQ